MAAEQTVDRFQILGELGRGAMGVVYRALDPEAGREVALKVLLGKVDAQSQARFEREGFAAAAVRHPGIVSVHAAGVDRGRPFLAYELLEGVRTLEEAMPDLALRRKVELLRDAGRALGAAHAAGVVHRDIKPANLLLDASGRLRVADFGVALVQGEERLTQTGGMLGTPLYMAPEQFSPRAKDEVGARSDVWSLGAVLYVVLTGVPPFEGENLLDLMASVMKSRPTPPRALAPNVPRAFEAVCLRALSLDAADRFADGEAFAAALDEALAGGTASRGSTAKLGVAAALVAAGALLMALSLAGSDRPPEPPLEPAEPSARTDTSGARAAAVETSSRGAAESKVAAAPYGRQDLLAKLPAEARPLLNPQVEALLRENPGRGFYSMAKLLSNEYPRSKTDLLRLSAEQGYVKGMLEFADALQDARGVTRDDEASLRWFTRAVEVGVSPDQRPSAFKKIIRLLSERLSRPEEAYVWCERGSALGIDVCKAWGEQIRRTGVRIDEDPEGARLWAERIAREWLEGRRD